MTDDRENAPICPWCGERLEMLQSDVYAGSISWLAPISLDCSNDECEYSISLVPEPMTSAPVASGSVGRA